MANPEHLAKLKEGVEAWNEWRAGIHATESDLEWPDLSGADLSEADLRTFDLRGANLSGTDLSGADLCGADLSHATLCSADLSGAKLSGARLQYANLGRAVLFDCDLRHADLRQARLDEADLRGADLQDTDLCAASLRNATFSDALALHTVWGAVDLSEAKALDQIDHVAPSTVGTDTLRKSKGRLSAVFLRGCGLADWEIENAKLYEPSLRKDERTTIVYEVLRLQLRQPIMFHSVFISYSTSDMGFATVLYDDLQKAGVRCWFAPHDMAGGKKLHEQIDRAIQVQDRLLLILSEASLASEWVNTEIANARAKEREQKRRVLFPIALIPFDEIRKWKAFDGDMGKDSAREIREYFIPDFSNWKDAKAYRVAFDRLLKDLRSRDVEPRE